jgi:hypothetical protein
MCTCLCKKKSVLGLCMHTRHLNKNEGETGELDKYRGDKCALFSACTCSTPTQTHQ